MIVQCSVQQQGKCPDGGEFCFFGPGQQEVDGAYYMFEHLQENPDFTDHCEIIDSDVLFVKIEKEDPQCESIW